MNNHLMLDILSDQKVYSWAIPLIDDKWEDGDIGAVIESRLDCARIWELPQREDIDIVYHDETNQKLIINLDGNICVGEYYIQDLDAI